VRPPNLTLLERHGATRGCAASDLTGTPPLKDLVRRLGTFSPEERCEGDARERDSGIPVHVRVHCTGSTMQVRTCNLQVAVHNGPFASVFFYVEQPKLQIPLALGPMP
jgi:hypothetical protein